MVGKTSWVEWDEGGELWDVDCERYPRRVGFVVDAFALERVNDKFQKPRIVEFGLVLERSKQGGVIGKEVVETRCCVMVNEHDGVVCSLDMTHECFVVWFRPCVVGCLARVGGGGLAWVAGLGMVD